MGVRSNSTAHYCLVFSTDFHRLPATDPEHCDFLASLNTELTKLKGKENFHFARLAKNKNEISWESDTEHILEVNLLLKGKQGTKANHLVYICIGTKSGLIQFHSPSREIGRSPSLCLGPSSIRLGWRVLPFVRSLAAQGRPPG